MVKEKIFVTRPFMPPYEQYAELVQGIFERRVLTNQGPLVRALEQGLATHLGVNQLQYLCNGTIAIQLALRALELEGAEVITTPFSYVATTSSLLWEGCRPVFVDIEPKYFTIDPDQVEKAITPDTRAILAVHVFGRCCQVERLADIAKKHNLKIIYDGAHAFGSRYKGESVCNYGDVTTLSFHATKLFHTVEGGACIALADDINNKIDLLRRFGHRGDEHMALGINGKQSEFHAAMGLVNLKHLPAILESRRQICQWYTELLQGVVDMMPEQADCEWNYAYFPVVFKSYAELDRVFSALNNEEIYPRRYFYPSLNQLPYLKETQPCPIAEDITQRIACLPLYPDIRRDQVEKIAAIIRETVN